MRANAPRAIGLLMICCFLATCVTGKTPVAGAVSAVQPLRLAGPDVRNIEVTPDSSRVVYVVAQGANSPSTAVDLYSVPIDGGTPVKLNASSPEQRFAFGFSISPDGRRVLYLAQGSGGTFQLYSVPVAGGSAQRINAPLAANVSVGNFLISADSSRVVYQTQQSNGSRSIDLFSAPIEGGDSVRLNAQLVGEQFTSRFKLTPDGSRVVFEVSQGPSSTDPIDLYTVPLSGGDARLIGPSYPPSNWSFILTPDSQRVVYPRTTSTSDADTLLVADLLGGVPRPLSLPSGTVARFGISVTGDSSRVVFTASNAGSFLAQLYSAPLSGEPAVRLNAPLPDSGSVRSYNISPDGSRVVYTANPTPFGQSELFSVPVAGGEAVKLNGPLDSASQGVLYGFISPDGSRVVYVADQQPAPSTSVRQLYSVPITGGATLNLSDPLYDSSNIFDVLFTADGKFVLYRAEYTSDSLYDLLAVPVDGSERAHKVNGNIPYVPGPDTRDIYGTYRIAPDGSRVVFRGAASTDGERSLYMAPVAAAKQFTVLLPFAAR